MNGEPVQVGKYAGSMRRHLFKEHLGLLETPDETVDVGDVTSDDFYKGVWLKFSSKNTDVFEKVGTGSVGSQVKWFGEGCWINDVTEKKSFEVLVSLI